jgi:hypothetical protein
MTKFGTYSLLSASPGQTMLSKVSTVYSAMTYTYDKVRDIQLLSALPGQTMLSKVSTVYSAMAYTDDKVRDIQFAQRIARADNVIKGQYSLLSNGVH